MSDTTTPTDQTTPTPDAGAVNQAAAPATEPAPFRTFKDQAELDSFMAKSKRQVEKRALNEQAKAMGYEDWEEMSQALQPLRRGAQTTPETPQDAPTATAAPTVAPTATNEAQRLRMALTVASDAGLPTTLVSRLQGDTPEEMKADADRLMALFQQQPRGPGIPSVPKGNQPVTFTRTQLNDPKFVREHKDAILLAGREGRIVDS